MFHFFWIFTIFLSFYSPPSLHVLFQLPMVKNSETVMELPKDSTSSMEDQSCSAETTSMSTQYIDSLLALKTKTDSCVTSKPPDVASPTESKGGVVALETDARHHRRDGWAPIKPRYDLR